MDLLKTLMERYRGKLMPALSPTAPKKKEKPCWRRERSWRKNFQRVCAEAKAKNEARKSISL